MNIKDANYWQQLNPLLSVEGKGDVPAFDDGIFLSDEELDHVAVRLQIEGWFQINDFFPSPLIARLRDAVLVLDREGWLPIYAFVYDEMWQFVRTRRFKALMTRLLGAGYMQKVAAWSHFTLPQRDRHGWHPHVDGSPVEGPSIHPDGSARMVSLWLPLTDVTPDNGCMYLLPKNRALGIMQAAQINGMTPNILNMLHATRALPTSAGTLACWSQDVLHWGSYCSGYGGMPRISVALEFQSRVRRGNPIYPLLDGNYIPATLNERLLFVAHQIARYLKAWEPTKATPERLEMAESIKLAHCDLERTWIACTQGKEGMTS